MKQILERKANWLKIKILAYLHLQLLNIRWKNCVKPKRKEVRLQIRKANFKTFKLTIELVRSNRKVQTNEIPSGFLINLK